MRYLMRGAYRSRDGHAFISLTTLVMREVEEELAVDGHATSLRHNESLLLTA